MHAALAQPTMQCAQSHRPPRMHRAHPRAEAKAEACARAVESPPVNFGGILAMASRMQRKGKVHAAAAAVAVAVAVSAGQPMA